MPINPDGVQCWHTDEDGNLDCHNPREYQCSHCKHFMCFSHTREHTVEGHPRLYCSRCSAALFPPVRQRGGSENDYHLW